MNYEDYKRRHPELAKAFRLFEVSKLNNWSPTTPYRRACTACGGMMYVQHDYCHECAFERFEQADTTREAVSCVPGSWDNEPKLIIKAIKDRKDTIGIDSLEEWHKKYPHTFISIYTGSALYCLFSRLGPRSNNWIKYALAKKYYQEVTSTMELLAKDCPDMKMERLNPIIFEATLNGKSALVVRVEDRGYCVRLNGSNHEVEINISELPRILSSDTCFCGRQHKQFGFEVEFDAPNYTKFPRLTDDCGREILGRDGSGQGEIRSIAADRFEESAGHLLEHYLIGLNHVDKSIKEMRVLKALQKKFKHASFSVTPENNYRDMPNGIHVHTKQTAYMDVAAQWLAVWWNQHSPEAKTMLERRLNKNYGFVDASRVSDFCDYGLFKEYRQFNAPCGAKPQLPEELKLFLDTLKGVIELAPTLPTDRPRYGESSIYRISEEWVKPILEVNHV